MDLKKSNIVLSCFGISLHRNRLHNVNLNSITTKQEKNYGRNLSTNTINS